MTASSELDLRQKQLHVAISGMLGRDVSKMSPDELEGMICDGLHLDAKIQALAYFEELTHLSGDGATPIDDKVEI